MQAEKRLSLQMIVYIGVLTAMNIVLDRFLTFGSPLTKYSFSFVPIVIAAMLFGAIPAGIVGGLGDFLGAILFPTKGAYFPGFTLTAIAVGVIWGLFVYKNKTWLRIMIAVLITQIVCGLLINTFWLSLITGENNTYMGLFALRLPQCLVMIAIEFVTTFALIKPVELIRKTLKR